MEGVGFKLNMQLPDLGNLLFKNSQAPDYHFPAQTPDDMWASYWDHLAAVIAKEEENAAKKKKQYAVETRANEFHAAYSKKSKYELQT